MEVDHPAAGPSTVDEPMFVDQPPQMLQGHTTPVTATGRPNRNRRLPARYRDEVPQSAPPVIIFPPDPDPEPASWLPRVLLIVRDGLKTVLGTFGLWRNYAHRPSYDPDSVIPDDDLTKPLPNHTSDRPGPSHPGPPWPYQNMSVYHFMTWLNTGSKSKSEGEAQRLVDEVLQAEDFNPSDLRGLNVRRENRLLDLSEKTLPLLDNFKKASISIEVPSGDKNVKPTKFTIPGLRYRTLTSVIRSAFQHPLAHHYHLSPFKLFHKPLESDRVYSEVYNSDAFIEEHDRIQRHGELPPNDPHCKREKVIAALMFWSDATLLAQFGTMKLWPIYLMLGNLSKYIRAKMDSGACHHVAYIPSVCDLINFGETRLIPCCSFLTTLATLRLRSIKSGTHSRRTS
jgi:hypothetical protein